MLLVGRTATYARINTARMRVNFRSTEAIVVTSGNNNRLSPQARLRGSRYGYM